MKMKTTALFSSIQVAGCLSRYTLGEAVIYTATIIKRSGAFVRKLALLIAGVAALNSGVANATLIHKYTFDSGSVAIDSVGGANGTLFGGAAIVGGQLSLDGSSGYVQTLGNHIVPVSGDFTVYMSAKQTAFGSGHVELISQGATGTGFYIGYDPAHHIRITDSHQVTTIDFPVDGKNHSYALTLADSTANFYIDAVLQGTFHGIERGLGGDDTRFGDQFSSGCCPEFFHGFIDNVQVWNNALSSEEIAAIPEPETYAMLLAGLGLVGFMARCKKVSAA